MLFNVLLFCLIFTCSALESNFYREESCAKARGYCVLEKECPHEVGPNFKNLCKNQIKEGAVCCKNFPENQVNCNQLHNVCRPTSECPEFINKGQKGCKSGSTCCDLV